MLAVSATDTKPSVEMEQTAADLIRPHSSSRVTRMTRPAPGGSTCRPSRHRPSGGLRARESASAVTLPGCPTVSACGALFGGLLGSLGLGRSSSSSTPAFLASLRRDHEPALAVGLHHAGVQFEGLGCFEQQHCVVVGLAGDRDRLVFVTHVALLCRVGSGGGRASRTRDAQPASGHVRRNLPALDAAPVMPAALTFIVTTLDLKQRLGQEDALLDEQPGVVVRRQRRRVVDGVEPDDVGGALDPRARRVDEHFTVAG